MVHSDEVDADGHRDSAIGRGPDRHRRSVAVATIEAIAEAHDKPPLQLEPLQHVIDTEALDRFIDSAEAKHDASVSFWYDGSLVTVRERDDIEVRQLGEAR